MRAFCTACGRLELLREAEDPPRDPVSCRQAAFEITALKNTAALSLYAAAASTAGSGPGAMPNPWG